MPRLLIVDDDVIVRTLLERRLRAAGYLVESAADGRAGLEAVRRWHPDVLLTDSMMPALDGPALVAAIRSDPALARTYIVVLSSREETSTGADACLIKPWSDAELLACMARGVSGTAHSCWEPAGVGGCG